MAAQKTAFEKETNINKLLKANTNDERMGRNYLRSLFESSSNKGARNLLSKNNPELYNDVKGMWVKDSLENPRLLLDKNTGIIDAKKVRAEWLNPNREAFKEVFGEDQLKAFDNFLAYAEAAGPMANKTLGKQAAGQYGQALGTSAAIAGASHYAGVPAIASVPIVELSSSQLVRSLTNPNSKIFKIFTTKSKPARDLAARMLFGFKVPIIVASSSNAK